MGSGGVVKALGRRVVKVQGYGQAVRRALIGVGKKSPKP